MSDTEEWIGNLENECEFYDKDPTNIKITYLYISKGNNIKHIKKEKIDLDENSSLTKVKLISLLNIPQYKLVGLLKCNANITIDSIKNKEDSYKDICEDIKQVNELKWNKTTNFLDSLNDLIVLFKLKINKQTKKNKLGQHNKTRKVLIE